MFAWLPYKCAVLGRAVYGPSATERLLGANWEVKENFLSLPCFYFVAI